MALTVRANTTIDSAFMVYVISGRISSQRPTQQVAGEKGIIGTKVGTAWIISGSMTFAIDKVKGVGIDLTAWQASEVGKLVEIDRGPKHIILSNCFISGLDDNWNPGQGQRDVSVNFTAETQQEISSL